MQGPASMNNSRHHARVVALQGLYQLDIQRIEDPAQARPLLQPLLDEAGTNEEAAEYARHLVQGVWSRRNQYDEMIAQASRHWDVSRMVVVDRNVLRLALYELLERPDVPPRVVIDEAVEIAREFGSAETPPFVNGVLDAIYKKHPACRIARGEAAAGAESTEERIPSADGTV